MENNFPTDQGGTEWFWDDCSTSHILYTLFLLLHQLHLRSSGIRSRRLGTPGLGNEQTCSWHLLYAWASMLHVLLLLAVCPSGLFALILDWGLRSVPEAEPAPPMLTTLICKTGWEGVQPQRVQGGIGPHNWCRRKIIFPLQFKKFQVHPKSREGAFIC